jgi:hypothetical protein
VVLGRGGYGVCSEAFGGVDVVPVLSTSGEELVGVVVGNGAVFDF